MPIGCGWLRQCSAAAFADIPKNGGISRCAMSRFPARISMCRCNNAAPSQRQLQTQIELLDQIVIVEFFGGLPFECDLAVDDDIATIGDPDGLIEVLLGHENCECIALFHLRDCIDGAADENWGESHRWFIDQKNLWRQHKSATECQHLLLATGEAAGELTTTLGKPRKSFEADGEIARELGPRSRAIGAEQEIFFDRQHRKQSAPLRHERDAEIDDVLRGAADQVVMNAVD